MSVRDSVLKIALSGEGRARRRSFAAAAPIAALIALCAAGCHSARRGEPLRGPLRLADAKAQRGQIAFMRSCHRCHPGGDAGLGPAINNKPLPAFLVKFQIRRGLGVMPSFSKERISEAELDDLISYMKIIRHR